MKQDCPADIEKDENKNLNGLNLEKPKPSPGTKKGSYTPLFSTIDFHTIRENIKIFMATGYMEVFLGILLLLSLFMADSWLEINNSIS